MHKELLTNACDGMNTIINNVLREFSTENRTYKKQIIIKADKDELIKGKYLLIIDKEGQQYTVNNCCFFFLYYSSTLF